MIMEEQNRHEYIDLREVVRKIWDKKNLLFKVWIVTFILACAWILPVPREYVSEVMLAPESNGGQMSDGMLGSLASSFGLYVGAQGGSDAFYPMLYPDLISSNDFIVGLFDIKVTTADGSLTTDYYTYMKKHQKVTFYKWPQIWARRKIKELLASPTKRGGGENGKIDPFYLSENQYSIVQSLKDKIKCSVDKKTDVFTITVIDQDPLICATMADSVRQRLQDFIISYRTSKARIDKDYYEKLTNETYKEYERSMTKYNRFCDTHRNAILQSIVSERDALENDMMIKFQTYQAMCTQYEAAKAKVQESTPAFTILQGASVPIKPERPKRMIFVAAMLFLATFATSLYIMFFQNIKILKSE